MKKFLLFLTCVLTLFGVATQSADAKEQTYTGTVTQKLWSSNSGAKTINNVSWTLSTTGTVANNQSYDETKGQGIGSNSSNSGATITLTTNGISGTIKNVTVNSALNASKTGSISVTVGGKSFGSTYSIASANSGTSTNYSFDGSGTGEIAIKWTLSSKTAIYFKTIKITYDDGESETVTAPKTITFSPNEKEITTLDKISIEADGTPAPQISYCIDNENGNFIIYTDPFTLTPGPHKVYAKAWNSENASNPISGYMEYSVTEKKPDVYRLATSISDIGDEVECIFINKDKNKGLGVKGENSFFSATNITVNEDNTVTELPSDIQIIKISKYNSNYSLSISEKEYICPPNSGNGLTISSAPSELSLEISSSDYLATISPKDPNDKRYFQYNTSSPRFQFYAGMQNPLIFVKSSPRSLGELQYTVTGDKTIEDDEITVNLNDVFTFSAENATNIDVLVDNQPANGKFENGVYTWTIDKFYDAAVVKVTPEMGQTKGKTLEFRMKVIMPIPGKPVVTIDGVAFEGSEKYVPAGTEIEISCENAVKLDGYKNGEYFSTTTLPFKYTINEDTEFKIKGINENGTKGEELEVSFKIGKVDPNLPKVGSNFRQIASNKELTPGYYVLARVNGTEEESVNYAMSTDYDSKNSRINSTTDIKAFQVGNDENNMYNIISTDSDNVLILKIEKDETDNWYVKTANYGDGLESSQMYIYAPSEDKTDLTLDIEERIAFISINNQKNASINFSSTSGRSISLPSGTSNGYFNYLTGGKAVQLYQFTTAKVFDYKFEDLILNEGDVVTIEVPEEAPEISYKKTGKSVATTIISIEGDQIKANRNDERIVAEVEASWDHSKEWFAGKARFNVSVLVTPQMEFRHDEVRGKQGVGVNAQAVYYDGDGVVKYSVWYDDKAVPATELNINPNTGMIRPEDIIGAVIDRKYTIKAEVAQTGVYKAASDTYFLTIEAPDEAKPASGTATFDFVNVEEGKGYDRPYGMFAFTTSNADAGQEHYYENNNLKAEWNHTPVTHIVGKGNDNLSLDFAGEGKYRSWNNDGFHLRVYNGTNMCFSIAEGSIERIDFGSSSNSNSKQYGNMKLSENNPGNYATENNAKTAYWKAPEGKSVDKVEFTCTGTVQITDIKVYLKVKPSDANESALAFDVSDPNMFHYFNLFEDEEVPLPYLEAAERLKFTELTFDIDEISEWDEDETYRNYEIKANDFDDIKVVVHDPGVYTFRAEYDPESDKAVSEPKFLKGMAILRLNVFPHIAVVPSEDHPSTENDMSADVRNVTLVDPSFNNEGGQVSEITLPSIASLNNDYKYSTISINKVTVCVGKTETVYGVDDEMPEKVTFTEDGWVSYNMIYAGENDFQREIKVHVIFMPQIPAREDGEGTYTLTPSHQADLQYAYVYSNQKNNLKRRAEEKLDWQNASLDENGSFTLNASDIEDVALVYYRSQKDKEEVLQAYSTIDNQLNSESGVIVLQALTINVGDLADMEWTPEMAAEGVDFSNILSAGSDDIDISEIDITVKVTPTWSTTTQPDAWSAETGMTDWLWDQMVAIQATEGNYVDGYYVAAHEDGFEVKGVQFPCSGVYELEFAAEGYEFVYNNNNRNINIYPSLTNKYSYTLDGKEYVDDILTIGGCQISDPSDNAFALVYPAPNGELDEKVDLTKMLLIVPGLYNAQYYYNESEVAGSETQKVESDDDSKLLKRKAASLEDYTKVNDYHLNLSGMSGLTADVEQNLSLSLMATKNGATTPTPTVILISLNTKVDATPTGVEAIGGEDEAEVEYFTLDGFKVQNPDRGIYIMKKGNVVTKVMK